MPNASSLTDLPIAETRLLLVGTNSMQWSELRSVLLAQENVTIVGDVRSEKAAIVAACSVPDAILLDVDASREPVRLAAELRSASEDSRLVFVGKPLDHSSLVALGRLGVEGFCTWEDLAGASVQHVLGAAQHGLRVASLEVVEKLLAVPEGRSWPRVAKRDLNDDEIAVLGALFMDARVKDVPGLAAMSPATVGRVIARLKGELHVTTEFMLGVRAAQMGFAEPMDEFQAHV